MVMVIGVDHAWSCEDELMCRKALCLHGYCAKKIRPSAKMERTNWVTG